MTVESLRCARWQSAGLACLAPFVLLAFTTAAHAADRRVIAAGMENPESVVIGHDGRLYMTVIGKSDVDGDGTVAVIVGGKPQTFAKGLDDPKGLVARGKDLFVADKNRVWKIDADGNARVYAAAEDFPVKPKFLNDIEVSPAGDVFVSDCGTFTADSAVYRITADRKVSVLVDQKSFPALKAANGLLMDGKDHLLVADFTAGRLYRASLADGSMVELASGLGGADGLARDVKGRIYVSDWKGGKVFVVKPGSPAPTLFADKFQAAADILYSAKGGALLVPDMKAGTLSAVTIDE